MQNVLRPTAFAVLAALVSVALTAAAVGPVGVEAAHAANDTGAAHIAAA